MTDSAVPPDGRRPHPVLVVATFTLLVGSHVGFVEAGHLQYTTRIHWFELMGLPYLFAAAGFVAWHLRPRSRTGKLMVLFSVLSVLPLVEAGSRVPILWTLGACLEWLMWPVLLYLVLTFPSDRGLTNPARLIIAIGTIGTFLTNGPALLPFYNPAAAGCPDCQPGLNMVLAHDDFQVVKVGNLMIGSHVNALGLLLLLSVLVIRFARSTWPQRRVVAPLYLATAVWVLASIYIQSGTALFWTYHKSIWLSHSSLFLNVVGHTIADAILAMPIGMLLGLWLSGRRRSRVGHMVVALGELPERARLEDVVRRTLRDDRARVGFRADEGYVYADGSPVDLPEPSSGLASTYLESNGETRAVIVHDAALLQEPELLQGVAAAARLAVDNDRLQAEVRAQLEEVRASRARLAAAADDARRRVERDLHDGAQQRLLALGMALQRAQRRMADDTETARAIMAEATTELDGALDELRELARGIHPAILSDEGLEPALRMVAERAPIPVQLECPNGRPRPPTAVESAAYFVVSEALANVAKHAQAASARVCLDYDAGRLVVHVEDDGVGGADVTCGSGLIGLHDRVAAAGGHLRVESPPGEGTRIVAELPCD